MGKYVMGYIIGKGKYLLKCVGKMIVLKVVFFVY